MKVTATSPEEDCPPQNRTHCFATTTVTIMGPDLQFEGVSDEDEEDPGGFLCINSGAPLPALTMQITGATDGTGEFQVVSGDQLIQMYEDAAGTQPVMYFNQSWDVSEFPITRYIRGVAPSVTPRDIVLKLTYTGEHGPCEDVVRLTVSDGEKVPLGGQLSGSHDPGCFKVYVPTKWGGRLQVSTTAGQIADLKYPDGAPYHNNTETGEDKHGWYKFSVVRATSYTVSTTFVEEGWAATRPWNGWYWPTEPNTNPNLYDPGYALDKYDQVYGTTAQAWEAANHVGSLSWEGHCWGWSVASILIPQPGITSENGVSFTRDDMEGLYSEAADGGVRLYEQNSVDGIPPGPPTPSTGEVVDTFCDDFHKCLRFSLRERPDPVAVQSNLRAAATPPACIDEVWNHAIWKYSSTMEEPSGADNEKIIRVTTTVWGNWDLHAPPTDGTTDRVEMYIYVMQYSPDGEIDGNYSDQNWISATHYVPAHIWRLQYSYWNVRNPGVTKANVDALYNP